MGRISTKRLGIALILALLSMAFAASGADAATTLTRGSIIFGDQDTVRLTSDGSDATISVFCSDAPCGSFTAARYSVSASDGLTVTAAGCTSTGANTATCNAATSRIERWSISAGAGNDFVDTDAICIPRRFIFCFGDPDPNAVSVPMTIDGGPGNDDLEGGRSTDTFIGGDGADEMRGAEGADTVSYSGRAQGVTVDLNDTGSNNGGPPDLNAGARDLVRDIESATGGNGPDTLIGTAANNTLTGNAGDDTVRGGLGRDVLAGGAGVDTVDYSERTSGQGVNVSLDGVNNDGADGELDAVSPDFEIVVGGAGSDQLLAVNPGVELRGESGNDQLFAGNGGGRAFGGAGNDKVTGGNGVDILDGGLGDDSVDGLGESDQLFGDAGADTIEARDGATDVIDCGLDFDTVLTDPGDADTNCEAGGSDADGDGFSSKQDCDDRNPNIRPNAVEIPGNDVDENCDGVTSQEVDRDGDGFTVSQDCDDNNRRIRPNAQEVPGNKVDENCDGRVARFTLPANLKVPVAWERFVGFTRLTKLQVTGLRKGAKVTLTCKKVKGKGKGPGCPIRTRKLAVRKGRANGTKLFRKARLRTGAVLQIRIATPGHLALVRTARFKNAKNPRFADRCQAPRAKKLRRCR